MVQLEPVLERIQRVCDRIGRRQDEIRVLAVTKQQPWQAVLDAYQKGIRIFGENRVQEAIEKYRNPLPGIELHLIGHLQSNKAKHIPRLFHWVDSIDRLSIAEELQKQAVKTNATIQVLLELNTSGEASKMGYGSYEALLRELERVLPIPNLQVRGLMTVGPLTDDPAQIRRAFRKLFTHFEDLKKRYPTVQWDTLSMGMSGDFEIAIEEGSTMIRIGTLLFGERGWEQKA